MAININIYSASNNRNRSISFDFVGEKMLTHYDPQFDKCDQYYFKISTSARTENNEPYPLKISKGMGDLALSGPNGSSQRIQNNTNNYSTIKEMIIDYVYDYVHGHEENMYGTGVHLQEPMRF